MEKNKRVREIINKLGGVTKTAERLGLERMTVHYWLSDGVPIKYWRWIVKQGVATWEDLGRAKVETLEAKERNKSL